MPDTTFTFRVDEDLKKVFAEAAKAQDRTAAQLLRVLMRDEVERGQAAREHDAWFRAEVEKGLQEADDPNTKWIPHEEVMKDWHRRRAQLLKRVDAKGGKSTRK